MLSDFAVFSWKEGMHVHAVIGVRARCDGETRNEVYT